MKLKFLGKASAEASFDKGEWEGVQKVLQSQQAHDNANYRDCVMKLTPLFINKFVPSKPTTKSKSIKRKHGQIPKNQNISQPTQLPSPTPSSVSQNMVNSPGSSQIGKIEGDYVAGNKIINTAPTEPDKIKRKEIKLLIGFVSPLLIYDIDTNKPQKLIFIVEAANDEDYDLYPNKIIMTGYVDRKKVTHNQIRDAKLKVALEVVCRIPYATSLLKRKSSEILRYDLLDFSQSEIQDANIFLGDGTVKSAKSNPSIEDVVYIDENGKFQLAKDFKTGTLKLIIYTGIEQTPVPPELIMELAVSTNKDFDVPSFMPNFIRNSGEKFRRYTEIMQEKESINKPKPNSATMKVELSTPKVDSLQSDDNIRRLLVNALDRKDLKEAIRLLPQFKKNDVKLEECQHVFDYSMKNEELEQATRVVELCWKGEERIKMLEQIDHEKLKQ